MLLCSGFLRMQAQSTSQKVRDILTELQGPDLQIGFQLMDIETGKVAYALNDTFSFTPASIQKCVTAFSALHYLGEDFVYKTPIYYTGEILDDGNLTGSIIIEGSGDPSMGSRKQFQISSQEQFFDAIALQIYKAGITCIDGDLILDVSEYGSSCIPRSWFWEDLGNYYGAGVWGINFNENSYDLYLQRGRLEGMPTHADHTDPAIPGLSHRSEVLTAPEGTGDQAFIFGAPYSYQRTIEGTIPIGDGLFKIKGSMPDPPGYFGRQMALALERRQIHFRSWQISYNKLEISQKKKITALQSPKFEALVLQMLEDSHNMYSEAFIKGIGGGSFEKGLAKVQNYLIESGVDLKNWRMVDGSGLSVLNKVSPDHMNRFLSAQCKIFGIQKIKHYLPEAGKEGTVNYMLKQSPARGHVWLKSGSMDRVFCYHGIINTAFRQNFAFTIMINGDITSRTKARQRIESLLTLIYQNQL